MPMRATSRGEVGTFWNQTRIQTRLRVANA